jgi:iron(III) transport system permease protein
MAALTAGLMGIPLFYIIYRALAGDAGVWARLWNTRIPLLLGNTLGLLVTVTALAIMVAVPLAWLVVKTDLPGRRFWRWALALPLAIPPYIGAFVYMVLFAPYIYGFGGTALVLMIFTYPYIFLLVAAALASINSSLEEAAMISGCGPWQVFRRVILPLLRPAIGSGSLLVALYVLADFGTVAMLRFQTFSSAIYTQLVGRYDRSAAAVLSAILVVITVTLIWLEWRSRAGVRYDQTTGAYRPGQIYKLGYWRYPALAVVLLVSLVAVFVPVGVLAVMTVQGFKSGAVGAGFLQYVWHSFAVSALAALAAVPLALPVAYLSVRHSSFAGKSIARLAYSGYALPGVVVALGVIFVFNRYLPVFYGTVALLVAAYLIRFLPQSLQAQETALGMVSPNLEEAGLSCGYNRGQVLRKITLPLIRPGLMAGWGMVFLSSMKELPATLLLRPAGFDTLAVRIWLEASEGFYELAAPASLLLIAASAGGLIFLNRDLGGMPNGFNRN